MKIGIVFGVDGRAREIIVPVGAGLDIYWLAGNFRNGNSRRLILTFRRVKKAPDTYKSKARSNPLDRVGSDCKKALAKNLFYPVREA